MKRKFIKVPVLSSTSPNETYPVLIDCDYAGIDVDLLESQIRDVLSSVADYVSSVKVNLGTLSIDDIRVFSTQKVPQLRVTSKYCNTPSRLSRLIDRLAAAVPSWIVMNDSFRGPGAIKAEIFVKDLIEDKFGEKPGFMFRKIGRIHYYHLTADTAEAIADCLESLKNEYGLNMRWSYSADRFIEDPDLYESGSTTDMDIYVKPNNPYFIYDRESGEYSIA